MLTMTRLAVSVVLAMSASAAAQWTGTEDEPRRVLIGPDGEMQFLPTVEEMVDAASRGTDISPFADYAQRRLELLGLVSEVVYVDDDAPVGGDGTSWQTAHQSLQDALAQDYSDRLVEIRMAQGKYRPDRFNGVNTYNPAATFSPRYEDTQEPTGVFRIIGGYAGLGASDPDQNDPQQFRTVITGDLLGDDGPDFTNYDDNTLVLFKEFNSELHGLVMERAKQAMVGDGNLTIDGCVVRFNAGSDARGAFSHSSGTLVVKRSTFFMNRSGRYGGAIAVWSGQAALVSNRILSNTAVDQGGGVFASPNSIGTLVLQNNYFAANSVRGATGSIGGAVAMYSRPVSACNTVVFNRSEDGEGGGYGRFGWFLADHYTVLDIYHENAGISGRGLHEQFPSLSRNRILDGPHNPEHHIRGSFVRDWESSESNRPGTYAYGLDSIRDNSGAEALFVDLAGPDGIIGTPDDDPTPRPDSPNIDRLVDLDGAELALLDFADLNENSIIDEPLPFDLLGNPRSINTPCIGDPNGGIDAGAIECSGDPGRFDHDRPISGRRVESGNGCSGDDPIRLYVRPNAWHGGDGSSWGDAFRELTNALSVARTHSGPVEIWLAAGTYLPDFSVPEWRASFRLTGNVTILGGFAGWEEFVDQRDPDANLTVLSGDRFGNDDPVDPISILDNAYRVVVVAGERGGGVIDGVTIRGGHARSLSYAGIISSGDGCSSGFGPYSNGAALSVSSGELILIDCTISGCSAYGAVACSVSGNGSLSVRNIRVLDDQFTPLCSTPYAQFDFFGVDSLIAPPVKLLLRESVLRSTQTTAPFSEFASGNCELTFDRTDAEVKLLRVQDLSAESSLLRGLVRVYAGSTAINNSTIIARTVTRFSPLVRPPAEQRLTLSNTIAHSGALTDGDLVAVSEAINCVYAVTNFATRVEEIVLNPSQFRGMFVDFDGPDGNAYTPDGDYRLAPGSPAINTGSNVLVGSDFDLDGNPRIIGAAVDRGAYEVQNPCAPDVNGDGVIDLDDLNAILTSYGSASSVADINGDGTVDMNDLNIVLTLFGQECAG